jgi:tape measure domain-containing protein
MATISSTIALNDQMTPVLRSIATSLAGVNAAFAQLTALSGDAIDTQNIQQANRALLQTEQAQDNVNQSLREGAGAADQLWGKIKGFIAAYAGWNVVQQTVAWSDEMTNIQARLAQVNDGSRSQSQLMRDIYLNAQNAHASLQGMADIVGRFGNNAKDAFSSNDELLAFSNQLYKMFSIAGTDQNGAAAAMLQLSQGLGAGVLRGEELNSVFEQAPIIIQTIADYLNVPIGKIRAMASEGKLTADVVKNALLGAAEKTNETFANMPLTFGAAWTMAKNTFQMNMLGLQKVISDTINQKQFQQILDGLTATISGIASFAIPVVKGIAGAVGFLYENWSLIAPVIGTVTGAMLAYKAVTVATAAVEAISKGVKIAGVIAQYAYAAAMGVSASATAAATAAQMGLNAAMLASPVTWIIAAVAAVIGLLYMAVAVINKVTGTTYSATGIITGIVWSAWAYIRNIIATVWNTVLSLAEFLMNVFRNPMYSIMKLVYNLLDTFSGMYVGILQGLDPVITALTKGFMSFVNSAIKGINWLSSALDKVGLGWGQIGEVTMTGTVASNAEAVRQQMLSAIDPGKAPEGYKSLSGYKMDMANPEEYAQAGYKAGAKFGADPLGTLQDALGLSSDPAIQALMDGQAQGNKLAAQTAKNTAPSSEEDYKYLKEIMTGRTVDRLSGTDIRIQMNNNNKINSALDLDSIVNALAQKLTGAMDSAAEGVHI